ncbi:MULTISPECIES: hypothetical protein [Pseudomonas syringae group]|uniref:Uncharacterized protein n=1 Tax=Pseudomonas amygdali pv. morsprunorum TaxID=129138 RepID=A0AB35R2V0_PSEA0|nr:MULTISPECIES: hypothetical protein [Pseudomonas syringae group]AVB14455.1 hypothetical protein BKM19_013270 [Pseudomonas amygdali pv. morsprunorum]KWS56735.1 hypothetical protein AL056_27430 [Pseudomonas amygdali pv. morsprunorum]KWS62750.1 hypothetical protein AL054_04110 [Pseudomonas amygdali pv. morsprunorum]MBD1107838.1 hypothetical protein [Pseudomonas amygdali pv. morsprunorum]MDT3222630.1 hypothetical protein [Pseudomonas amygdali pv. morsprunorum]
MFIGDSTKAVPYSKIASHPEFEQACADYLAATYGDNVAHAIPIAQREIHVGILYGYTEAQTQEMILGVYGLQPI